MTRRVRIRWGRLALAAGYGAVLVALTGALYVLQSIAAVAALLIEIGAKAHG